MHPAVVMREFHQRERGKPSVLASRAWPDGFEEAREPSVEAGEGDGAD